MSPGLFDLYTEHVMRNARLDELQAGIKISRRNQKVIESWQESYDKPKECIKKQRHHFASKGLYSQVFSVAMCGYESWAIKKAEH